MNEYERLAHRGTLKLVFVMRFSILVTHKTMTQTNSFVFRAIKHRKKGMTHDDTSSLQAADRNNCSHLCWLKSSEWTLKLDCFFPHWCFPRINFQCFSEPFMLVTNFISNTAAALLWNSLFLSINIKLNHYFQILLDKVSSDMQQNF